eukprot:2017371-Rhodomonas_salina.3
MRCPVLAYHNCYALSGTGVLYTPRATRYWHTVPAVYYPVLASHTCYVLSGTGTLHPLRATRYWDTIPAMRCPVLT